MGSILGKVLSINTLLNLFGSSRLCVISLTYIGSINLCVLCVFVVRYTPSPGGLYLRIHFTHQTQESPCSIMLLLSDVPLKRTESGFQRILSSLLISESLVNQD
ncbi:MAG: hypothetical protein EWV80_00970 [Microcystis aeruginosa Ma_QC_B_20070730_S2]|uniref:Uncharacterized protein n=1 Tax=Microcystis aeruginosa Ma_QC_B_20070730_S2 TaxID=2486256 RepID=A0A552E9J7_MICAE|nr:MAG: hypothetical protein EWV80_00970 [Microcystis aeruginosa Ma_QC_B_20070730_S2]